jgi:uncharacterized protein YndB with AHSA1/START domain
LRELVDAIQGRRVGCGQMTARASGVWFACAAGLLAMVMAQAARARADGVPLSSNKRSAIVQKTTTNALTNSSTRPVSDVGEGHVFVSVEIAAPPKRVFRALASHEVVHWWVRPGVFNTAEWTGELRVGGRWRASGLFRGEPYATEGEFLEVDPPRRLAHTWQGVGAPGAPTTVAYVLEGIDGGTRITLRHSGFTSREACANFGVGWETSFERLAEILGTERKPGS